MNIILKSFDGPYNHFTIERAFKGVALSTCISISWDLQEIPTLEAREHILMNSRDCKYGRYPGVRWTEITPLDEQLIEDMRGTEGTFMVLITRNALDPIPYADRRKQYFDHLRYWNHVLETKKIDLLLLNHPPHSGYDVVLYDLCRRKAIPTLYIDRCHPFNSAVFVKHWEEASPWVRDRFAELQEEFRDLAKPIPLAGKFEHYYQAQTVSNEAPWYVFPRPTYLTEKNFVRRWMRIALRMAIHRPRKFLSSVLSRRFWKRKLRDHRIIAAYDQHAMKPDYAKRYIYVPLHMQPEATTCPIGGAFVDQERLIQLIAWHLPEDVLLYVKEHPNQREEMRSIEFYQSLVDIPSVRLMERDTSTVDLMEHAEAVATVTGTAGFEGLFRGKPVLLFGHVFYQYARGVHMIRSSEDCRCALERIFDKKEKPTLRDARLYLKALEECGTTYEGAVLTPGETMTVEEQAVELGENLRKMIDEVMKDVSLSAR